jgi:hypothetical protein
MNLIANLLEIIEHALQNPQNKAAVQIAIDGVALLKDLSGNPKVKKLEADIAAYVALLPPAAKPAPPSEPAEPEEQNGVRGGPNAGRMRFDQ